MRYSLSLLAVPLFLLFGCSSGDSSSGDTTNGDTTPSIAVFAGDDQEVFQKNTVILSGSVSGTAVFQWNQLSGTPVTINFPNTLNATFTAPDVQYGETLLFALVAGTESDEVNITIRLNPQFTKYLDTELDDSAKNWDCVIDNNTDLMWEVQKNNDQYTWYTAQAYATNKTLCGFGDWRLPTKAEAEGFGKDPDYFPNQATFWTSDDALTPAHAWLWTSSGSVSHDKTQNSEVMLVRNY